MTSCMINAPLSNLASLTKPNFVWRTADTLMNAISLRMKFLVPPRRSKYVKSPYPKNRKCARSSQIQNTITKTQVLNKFAHFGRFYDFLLLRLKYCALEFSLNILILIFVSFPSTLSNHPTCPINLNWTGVTRLDQTFPNFTAASKASVDNRILC